MSFGIPFRCGITNESSNLCFQGSTCELSLLNNEIKEECVGCPSGWGHLLVTGHYPNCSQPDLFIPILYGFSCLLFLIAAPFIFRNVFRLRRGSRLQIYGFTSILFGVSENIHLLSLLVEGGRFEFASVMIFLNSLLGKELIIQQILIATTSSMPLLRRTEKVKIEKFWRIIQITFVLPELAFSILQVIYCRTDQIFNALFYLFGLVYCSGLLTLGLTSLLLMNRLIKKLTAVSTATQARDVTIDRHHHEGSTSSSSKAVVVAASSIERNINVLRNFRRDLLLIISVHTLHFIIPATTYLILGSVPYEWITLIFSMTTIAHFPSVLKFIETNNGEKVNYVNRKKNNGILNLTPKKGLSSSYHPIQSLTPDAAYFKTDILSGESSVDQVDARCITIEEAKREGFRWRHWSKGKEEEEMKAFFDEYKKWKIAKNVTILESRESNSEMESVIPFSANES